MGIYFRVKQTKGKHGQPVVTLSKYSIHVHEIETDPNKGHGILIKRENSQLVLPVALFFFYIKKKKRKVRIRLDETHYFYFFYFRS